MEITEKYPTGEDRVEAVYSDPVDPQDKGNLLIEALQEWKPFDKTMWTSGLKKSPSGPDTPYDIRIREIGHLKEEVRFPMPYDRETKERFRLIMESSYRRRWPHLCNLREKAVLDGKDVDLCFSQEEIIGEDTNTAMALIGISGSGKTKTVGFMLKEYPKLIIHTTPEGIFLQIPYVYVEAQTNDDMSTMYVSIAKYIDKVLRTGGKYERFLDMKRPTVNRKGLIIADLIMKFNIGVIVIDEIQKMSQAQSKGSLESLDEIINMTKVGVMTVGTEEAFSRIYTKAHRARRNGKPVHASEYCEDYDTFKEYVKWLYYYQWFPEKVTPSEETIKAHYDTACGTIGGLMDIYTEMNMRSLNKEAAGESVAVDADFVQSCAGAFAGQQARLQEAKEQDVLYAYKGIDVTRNAADPSKSVIDRQPRRMTDVVYDRLLGYFMARGSQYTPATIRKALDHVMNLKAAADMKADEVFEKARERIEKGGTDRRAHHRMSPMADVNTDNYRMPKIG